MCDNTVLATGCGSASRRGLEGDEGSASLAQHRRSGLVGGQCCGDVQEVPASGELAQVLHQLRIRLGCARVQRLVFTQSVRGSERAHSITCPGARLRARVYVGFVTREVCWSGFKWVSPHLPPSFSPYHSIALFPSFSHLFSLFLFLSRSLPTSFSFCFPLL